VSEVGFGLWTISWSGKFTEGEPVALMHKAFDLAVTLFDAADTYGGESTIPRLQVSQCLLSWPTDYFAGSVGCSNDLLSRR
jgi:aryl-alcohol dehydrogenase-like predicted oxidoreductase